MKKFLKNRKVGIDVSSVQEKKKEELADNDKNCTNGVVELAYDD